MERPFVAANAEQRERLRALVGSITEEQLQICLPNGWPIYCALAHLAFWDQRSTVVIRKWARDGITPSPIDPDIVNDALLPFFKAIPARDAAGLAVAAANSIDRELENASDKLIESIAGLGDRFRLYRSDHRKVHLDEIQEALGKP